MSAPPQRSFACPACQVLIYIPVDLPPTTAPCPSCGTTVTSPALPTPQPTEDLSAIPTLIPASIPDRRPATIPTTVPAPLPRATPTRPPEEVTQRKSTSSMPWFVHAALLLIVIAGTWWFYGKFIAPGSDPAPIAQQPTPAKTAASTTEFTWEGQARHALRFFLLAETPEEKARWVIGGKATVDRLHTLWGDQLFAAEPINPDDFAAIFTGDESSEQPIYLLLYERPVQYDIKKFFRPLVSMEVLQGAEALDPLTQSLTAPENFETPPLNIEAYFKQTADGLRLDYDIFLQTRHRTLSTFAESAPAGASAVFRIVIIEDVPLLIEKKNQRRVYRITDPIHITDSYRISTEHNSPASQQLSQIHWYGLSGVKSQFAAATVKISKQAAGEIHLAELICWDFDGLAGAPGLPWRGAVPAPSDAEKPAESPPSLTDP